MKTIILILMAVAIAAAVYVYLDPQLSQQVKQKAQQLTPDTHQSRTLYKWKDAQGQWQISDRPPTDGIPFETVQYDEAVNVMPAEAITGQKKAQ